MSTFELHCEKWIKESGLLHVNSDYNGMIGLKLQEMVKAFVSNGGNSGGSAQLTKQAFNAMVDAYMKEKKED